MSPKDLPWLLEFVCDVAKEFQRTCGRWRDSCLSMPMARSRSASWRSTGRGVCLLHTCHVAKLSTIFCVQRLVWSAQHLSTSGASNTIRQTNTNCGAVRGNRELRMWREQTPSLLPILDGYCMRGGLFLMWFIQSPRAFDGLCRVYCCVGRVGAMCICVCVCVTVCGVGAEGILMPWCMLNLRAPFFLWFLSACVLLSRGNIFLLLILSVLLSVSLSCLFVCSFVYLPAVLAAMTCTSWLWR